MFIWHTPKTHVWHDRRTAISPRVGCVCDCFSPLNAAARQASFSRERVRDVNSVSIVVLGGSRRLSLCAILSVMCFFLLVRSHVCLGCRAETRSIFVAATAFRAGRICACVFCGICLCKVNQRVSKPYHTSRYSRAHNIGKYAARCFERLRHAVSRGRRRRGGDLWVCVSVYSVCILIDARTMGQRHIKTNNIYTTTHALRTYYIEWCGSRVEHIYEYMFLSSACVNECVFGRA